MRLVVVSGLSGSGKSIALNMLEDLDYYCVDNIPAGLLPGLIDYTVRSHQPDYELTAVGLDARNRPDDLADVPRLVDEAAALRYPLRDRVPARGERSAAQALQRDSASPPVEPRGSRAAGSTRSGTAAARPGCECGRPDDRHLAPVGARIARAGARARRRARRTVCRRCCSSRLRTGTACRTTRISSSIRVRCPIPTGSRRCAG